jgi:hypothetical protein
VHQVGFHYKDYKDAQTAKKKIVGPFLSGMP